MQQNRSLRIFSFINAPYVLFRLYLSLHLVLPFCFCFCCCYMYNVRRSILTAADRLALIGGASAGNHEMVQLLRLPLLPPPHPIEDMDADDGVAPPLFCVGVLQRPPFFVWPIVLKHCDEVSAYDLRFDLTEGGSGNVSMA